jgi:hypothetical protein
MFSLNELICIIVIFIWEIRPEVARIESAFEIVDSDDTANGEKQQRNNSNIEKSGDSRKQSLNSDFQSFIFAHDS